MWVSLIIGSREEPSADAQTRELYLGAAADTMLSPEVYFFYDF